MAALRRRRCRRPTSGASTSPCRPRRPRPRRWAARSGAIANSLVFDADGAPLLVLASGAHRVDTAKVAALVGAERVRRATPRVRLAATGQEVGGVAPVGHPAPLRTVVDVDLAAFPLLWAGGGDHHTMFSATYEDLLRVTAGEAAAVA